MGEGHESVIDARLDALKSFRWDGIGAVLAIKRAMAVLYDGVLVYTASEQNKKDRMCCLFVHA